MVIQKKELVLLPEQNKSVADGLLNSELRKNTRKCYVSNFQEGCQKLVDEA